MLEKLRDAQLPDGVTPTLGPLSTPIGELYRYTLEGDGLDSRQLREIEDWVVEPRLLQVPGVTDITPFGGVIKQYQIEVDPLALTKYGFSIRDIAQAVDANNQNAGGALLDNQQQGLVVRGVGLIQSVDDIENVVVSTANDVPVFVRDIGRVQIGSAPQNGHLCAWRQDRPRRGNRADAARREPQRGARRACTKRWTSSTDRACRRASGSSRSTTGRISSTTRCTRSRTR